MDFRDTPEEAAFRAEVQAWLAENLVGEFARVGGYRDDTALVATGPHAEAWLAIAQCFAGPPSDGPPRMV